VVDKNVSVIHLLEHSYPRIRIAHDFHHQKRALCKAISGVAKQHKSAELSAWQKPMTNFCWSVCSQATFCTSATQSTVHDGASEECSTEYADEDYVERQYRSMLQHICGEHTNCTQHEMPFTPQRAYLVADSAVMVDLRKKLLCGRQLKAMRRCALFKQTSLLESHHGMRAKKWCPKNIRMSEATYTLHSALADLDTNSRTLEVATFCTSSTVHDDTGERCSTEYAKTRKVQHPASGTERERLQYTPKSRQFIDAIVFDARQVAYMHSGRIGSGHVWRHTRERAANYKPISNAKTTTAHDRLERLRRATDGRRPHVPNYLPPIL